MSPKSDTAPARAPRVPRRVCVWIAAVCAALLLLPSTAQWSVNGAGAAQPDAIRRRIPAGPRPVRNWPVILDNSIRHTPAVADIDGDGRDEIAVGVKDCRVFLLDGDGKTLPGWPGETAAWTVTGPMMDDIDGDGEFEIAIGSLDGFLHLWREDGGAVEGWPRDLGGMPVGTPVPVRAGKTHKAFLVVSTTPGTVHLVSPEGASRDGWPKRLPQRTNAVQYDHRSTWAADLDRDGSQEVLHLTSEPAVLHAWRIDGTPVPGYPLDLAERGGLGIAIDDPADPRLIACTTREALFLVDPAGAVLRAIPPPEGEGRYLAEPWFISSRMEPGIRPDMLFVSTDDDRVCLMDLEARILPGWPVRLDGFIYGIRESRENHSVYGPPIPCDADGDGSLELVLGGYDHHLYCFEFDGTPNAGWPVVLEDAVIEGIALAQLDGTGMKELVVGQYGETVFAFHFGVSRSDAVVAGRRASFVGSEWPPLYYAVSAAIIAMILLLVHLLRIELAGQSYSLGGLVRWALVFFLVALAVRAVFFAGDLYRYLRARDRLETAESTVRIVLRNERGRAQILADQLARGLTPCEARSLNDPLRALRCLERLTDRNRLEYQFAGIVLADRSGRVIQGVGLGRGWADVAELGLLGEGSMDPILLEDIPVYAVESRIPVLVEQDTLRFFLLSSLLNRVPNDIVDATGFSAHIRVDGRTMAWGGAGQRPVTSMSPWIGRVQPSRSIEIAPSPDGARMDILLTQEDFNRPLSEWLDLAAVLILPSIFLLLAARRNKGERIGLRGWWLLVFAVLYVGGAVLLHRGRFESGPISAAGRMLEVLLHMIGVTGFVVVLYRVATSQRSRQLNFTMLGSYLIVSLIPLTVLMFVGGNLLLEIQRDIIGKTMAELEKRADNLVLPYMGNMHFLGRLNSEASELFDQTTETAWLNFVEENQYLFNYDLPTAYLTLWAHERGKPEKFFTGYSYRAPRTGKLYYTRPAWTGREDIRGLFLDNGTAVVRAMRIFRTEKIEAEIVSHIPIDENVLEEMEERLHVLPYLPRIHLEPAWLESTEERSRPAGYGLPFGRELVLQARDWSSGRPRWVVYRAGMYIPAGGGMLQVLVPVLLLILLPLGLSFWGAYTTFRRTARPLSHLLTGIRRVGEGDLEYRLGESGQSEIGRAASAFDTMAENLEKTILELAEKRKAEEVVELKSRFLSMVSHDLKTPLSSIRGAVENILDEIPGPVNERQRSYLEMIMKDSASLQGMITDLLDLSRIEGGHMTLDIEPLDVRHEAEDLLRSIRPMLHRKGIEGRLVVGAERTIVKGDRNRIWRILSNIVSNAIRYSPEGGTIEIRIDDVPADRPAGSAMLMISVIDEGPGIPEMDADKLFEPFYYRSYGEAGEHGAGLGLAIVKQFVELHGGTVSIANSPSGGAVCSFTLPL